jgi:hypothetical protein
MNSHERSVSAAWVVLFLATLAIAQSSSTSKSAQAPSQPKMQNPMDALSGTGENHKLLARLVGTWSYTGKHLTPIHRIRSSRELKCGAEYGRTATSLRRLQPGRS